MLEYLLHTKQATEGHAEGLAKGIVEGTEQVAINLLKQEYPIDSIMEATVFSLERINELIINKV